MVATLVTAGFSLLWCEDYELVVRFVSLLAVDNQVAGITWVSIREARGTSSLRTPTQREAGCSRPVDRRLSWTWRGVDGIRLIPGVVNLW